MCRDITPDNIILTGVGPTISCKLLDFTAAMTEDEIPSDKALAIKRLYTSPEQYRALEGLALVDDVVDCPSDMWNLGATLLDLATGMKLIDMTESSLQALRYGYTDWSFEQDVLSAMSDDQYFLWCRQEEFVRLVIARSLRVHMKARPSAAEMLQLDDVLHARMQKTKRKSKSKKAKDLEEPLPDSQRLLTPSPMRQRRLQTPSRTKPSAIKARSSSVKKSVTIAASSTATDDQLQVAEQAAQQSFPMAYSQREEPPQHDSNSLASIIVSDSLLNASHVVPMSTTLVLSSPTMTSPSIAAAQTQPSPDRDSAEASHPVLKRSNSPVGSPTAVRSVRQKLGFQSVEMEPRTTTPSSSRSPIPTVDVAAMARRMVTADSLSSISTVDALHQIARALSTYSDGGQPVNLVDESAVVAFSATTTQDTVASSLPSPVSRRSLERQTLVVSGRSPRAAISPSPYSSRTASTIAAIAETLAVQAPTALDSDTGSVDSDRRSAVSSDNNTLSTDDSLSVDLQAMTLTLPLRPSSSPPLASQPPSATVNEQVDDIRIDTSDVVYSPQGYRVYHHEHVLLLPPNTTSAAIQTASAQRSSLFIPATWLVVPHATLRSTVTLLAMANVTTPSTVDIWEFTTASDGEGVARMKAHHRGSLKLDEEEEEEEVMSLLSLSTSGGLCAGYADGSVRIWDVTPLVPSSDDDDIITNAVCIHRLPPAKSPTTGAHETSVRCLLQSSWYGRLVVGRSNGAISIWTLAGQQPLFDLVQHQAAVTAFVEISDVRFVSSSEDGTLRLWHLEQRQCLHVFRGHVGGVSSLALWTTAHGQYLFSGGKDETLRVWDVDGRRGIGIVKHHHATDKEGVVSFGWVESAHGEEIFAVGGADGQVSLWSPSLLTSSGSSADSSSCIQRIPQAADTSEATRLPLTLPSTLIASIDGRSARPTSMRTVLGESKAVHHSGPVAVVSIHNNLSLSFWV